MLFPNCLKDTCTQMPQYHLFKCNVIKLFFKKLHFQQTSLDVCMSVKKRATSSASRTWERCRLDPPLCDITKSLLRSCPLLPHPSPGPNPLAPLTCSQASSTFSFNPSVIRLTLEQQRFQRHLIHGFLFR